MKIVQVPCALKFSLSNTNSTEHSNISQRHHLITPKLLDVGWIFEFVELLDFWNWEMVYLVLQFLDFLELGDGVFSS